MSMTIDTSIHHEPIFSVVYKHIDNLIFTGLNSKPNYFCKKKVVLGNGYPGNFVNKCFRYFIYSISIVNEVIPTVEKKLLVFVLLYLFFEILLMKKY